MRKRTWYLPASLAPAFITQSPFCLRFGWKYLHCRTEELELKHWTLILKASPLPGDAADQPTPRQTLQRELVVLLLPRARNRSHLLHVSQCWPPESARSLNMPAAPRHNYREGSCYGEGLGGVRSASSGKGGGCWWGIPQLPVSLGHLSGSGRAQHLSRLSWVITLTRRKVLTWQQSLCSYLVFSPCKPIGLW